MRVVIVLGVLFVISVFVTIVVVVVVPIARKGTPSVKYTSVEAVPGPTQMGGHELVVHIELEATSDMPHVGPHVEVSARCGPHSDKRDGFFMTLGNLKKGAAARDDVHLFFVPNLQQKPQKCEIALSLTGGGVIEKYCYDAGKTTHGACP